MTKERNNRNTTQALTKARDEIEQVLIQSGYLDGAPFTWVTISVRFGLKDDEAPSYERINAKYGDLPLAIEVDSRRLHDASAEELSQVFRECIVRALVHAGRMYKRPTEELERRTAVPAPRTKH